MPNSDSGNILRNDTTTYGSTHIFVKYWPYKYTTLDCKISRAMDMRKTAELFHGNILTTCIFTNLHLTFCINFDL